MITLASVLRSPRALLIFEAAARLGSCSAAAREFNLTQPSVSRNIALLEQALSATLFIRRATGLEPTADGELLYRTMTEVLGRIDATLNTISARHARQEVVELSLSTAFVTHWFMPRLQAFHDAFPEVDLRFQLTSGALKGPPGNVDLAMRRPPPGDDNDRTWHFAPEIVLPVCSPAYLERHGALEESKPHAGHVLLELTGAEIDWRKVLGARPQDVAAPGSFIEFSDYAVVLQAAMGGQGIALGWISAISPRLLDGSLVPASSRRLITGRDFCLVAPRGRPVRDIVLRIRDWMVAEMAGEILALAPILKVEDRKAAQPRRAQASS